MAAARDLHVSRTALTSYADASLKHVNALLLDSAKTRASLVRVPVLAKPNSSERFPCLEAILGTSHPIHDCTVVVRDGAETEHSFMISCQVGPSLSRNRTIEKEFPDSIWRGSLVIMKAGSRVSFISMTCEDRALAFGALTKFLLACQYTSSESELQTHFPSLVDV